MNSLANGNVEIQTLTSGTHIFIVGIKYQVCGGNQIETLTFAYIHIHIETHIHAYW